MLKCQDFPRVFVIFVFQKRSQGGDVGEGALLAFSSGLSSRQVALINSKLVTKVLAYVRLPRRVISKRAKARITIV